MCNKMTLQETTRSRVYYFVKKKLIIADKYHLLWIYSYIFLQNILDNIVIFKWNGSLLKYNNY